jgi:aminoglycoside phosphotransferase (APT) family kinase protein
MTTLTRLQAGELMARWIERKLERPVERVDFMDGPSTAGFSSATLLAQIVFGSPHPESSRDIAIRLHDSRPGLFLGGDLTLQWKMIENMASRTEIPVPLPVGYEPDASILGAPFTVVSKVPGRVAPQVPNYNTGGWIFDLPIQERDRVWRNALETLAAIHRVDWRKGFEFLAKPRRGRNGLEQMLDWIEEWYSWSRCGVVHSNVELALNRLRQNQPANAPDGVLWGDAAPNNMLFGADLEVTAVLDWEAAALGPGEADLAWWLFYDEYLSAGFSIPRLQGLPDRRSSIEIYENALGRPVQNLEYYELLAHTRNAILSLRSVNRQIERGTIDADSTATTRNPTSRMLALKLGLPPPEIGSDYAKYLEAVVSQKTAAALSHDLVLGSHTT